jgi:hypothetical protein
MGFLGLATRMAAAVAASTQGIIWTRFDPASLPEGMAGVWFNDFGTPDEPLPPEIERVMCVSTPIRIDSDGLVVFFEG